MPGASVGYSVGQLSSGGVQSDMGAALSIVILFTISSTIVRVMSVVLEHTGVPQSVARIQVLSAFSGTGFTTAESEMLLDTAERRRILTILMISGSVGLASISATLIVGALGVADTSAGILKQIGFIVAALIFVRYIIFAGAVDDLVCAAAERWLQRHGYEMKSYTVLHRLGSDMLIAEHWIDPDAPMNREVLEAQGLQMIGSRLASGHDVATVDSTAGDGGPVVMVGSRAAHDQFASLYGSLLAQEVH